MQVAGKADSLSPLTRQALRLVAALFTALGALMFFIPDWASANFLWNVSPFVAMTMGAWYLGMAYTALEVAWVWRWSGVYAASLMLGSFSVMEAGVLVVHADKLRPSAAFGWPYMVVIGVTTLVTLMGVYDWLRLRPSMDKQGEPVPRSLRAGVAVFAIAVLLIAIFPILGYGQNQQIFPEKLTVFTLNAFGVFYLSIALGALLLYFTAKGVLPLLVDTRVGVVLIITITLAAVLRADAFNFSAHPGQILYWAAYIGAGIATIILLVRRGAWAARWSPAELPAA